MQQLAETYDNCRSEVGPAPDGRRPLLPICHITAQAHIEIAIDFSGQFRRARLITQRETATTIIPSSEASASRAGSQPQNHPLCDKLQYIAGDFARYGGEVTSGFAKDPQEPYRNFVALLSAWCASPYCHPMAQAVLRYVEQQRVIHDLAAAGILWLDSHGKLRGKDPALDKGTQNIFSLIDRQDVAFVRWMVEEPEGLQSAVWREPSLYDSWINYYLSGKENSGFCFVSGEERALIDSHPKYVRWEGDGAKLISANDTSNFTFRGRFLTSEQACGVGLEVSHKAHYALAWLIDRQGYSNDGLAAVAWAKSGAPVPQPTASSGDLLFGDTPAEEPAHAFTAQDLALQLKLRIAGYGKTLPASEQVVVAALDAATTGRLALIYYRDLSGSDFLQRIDHWHESCAWLHRYQPREVVDQETGKVSKHYPPCVGAPSPRDIAAAAYGTRDDKLRKATVQRLLPCIVEGQSLPHDLVESAVRRACNRLGLKNPDDKRFHGDDEYTWNKTLSIACALYRKSHSKEKYDMALDPTRTTRDYLYGRLLALADNLEDWALRDASEERQTSAARLMQRFAQHPYTTWRTIELALTPYKAQLGGKAWRLLQAIDEVIAAFAPADFTSDRPLTGEFLLGYHSQREAQRAPRAHQQPEAVQSTH
jgi:CRISPR-associated protein Csd1